MIGTDQARSGTIRALTDTVTRYIKLLIEDTRLNAAEKLIRLLSAVAISALVTILVTAVIVFVSIAVGLALSEVMNPLWAFLIVAAFYLVILVVLIVCRNTLIITPIARFISRLLLPAPQPEPHHDQPAPVSK